MATATKKPPAAVKKGKPAPAPAKPAAKGAAPAKAAAKPAAKAALKPEKPHAKSEPKSKSKKAAAPPPPPVYVSPFSAGNRVTHPSFGDGKVMAVEGDKLTIQFGKDEKVIIDSFVKSAPKS
jgi:hypothetical protein